MYAARVHCTPAALALLMRQVSRWLLAAQQDRDAAVQFLHATYGIGVLDVARQLADDRAIYAATGHTPRALLEALSAVQDRAQAALTGMVR